MAVRRLDDDRSKLAIAGMESEAQGSVEFAKVLSAHLGKIRGIVGCQAIGGQDGRWKELARFGRVPANDRIEAELAAFDPLAGGAVRPTGADRAGWYATYSCAGPTVQLYVVILLDPLAPAELQTVLAQVEQRIGWVLVEAERVYARSAGNSALSVEIGAAVLIEAAEAPSRTVLADQWIARLERALGPELVGITWVDDHKPRLSAISGGGIVQQPSTNRSAIETLASLAVEQRSAVSLDASTATSRMAEAMAQLQATRALCVPIYEGDACRSAAVMLWADPAARVPDQPAADMIGKVLGEALTIQARSHPSVLWRVRNWLVGFLQTVFGRRALKLKIAALGVAGAMILAALTPTTHRPAFNARIEARDRLVIAAPFDGFLSEAPVQLGDQVTPGKLLIRMEDSDLRLEVSRLAAERAQLQSAAQNARALRDMAETRNLDAKLRQNAVESALVEDQLARATVSADRAALVVSGDAPKRIGGRVRLGDTLLELATKDSLATQALIDEDWVADLPEHATATLLLAAWPDRPIPMHLTRITSETEQSDGANAFIAWLDFDQVPDLALMDGMRGIVRVDAKPASVLQRFGRGIGRWASRTLWRWE